MMPRHRILMLALTVLASAALPGCASDAPPNADHPALMGEMPDRLKSVRDQLPDDTSPFTLIVRIAVKPEHLPEFNRLADQATFGTRREPGNRAYIFHHAMTDPGDVVLYEHWRSFRDLRLHFAAEHMKPFFARVGDLLAAPPELKVYRRS